LGNEKNENDNKGGKDAKFEFEKDVDFLNDSINDIEMKSM